MTLHEYFTQGPQRPQHGVTDMTPCEVRGPMVIARGSSCRPSVTIRRDDLSAFAGRQGLINLRDRGTHRISLECRVLRAGNDSRTDGQSHRSELPGGYRLFDEPN